MGARGERCAFRRTFHATIGATGVQVSVMNLDALPLAAMARAEIAVLRREARAVVLEARTPYGGQVAVSWEVTGGALDTTTGRVARWTLPDAPGVYQAELLLDYGAAGVAFETLMLEVTS